MFELEMIEFKRDWSLEC